MPDRLQWRRGVGNPKERGYVRVAGVAPDVDIVPFTDGLDTLLRAVTERVFLVKNCGVFTRPPRPETGAFDSALSCVRSQLEKLLPSTAPVSHQQFVDHYKGCKREFYQRALDDLRNGRSTLEEDASVSVFIKYEKTDWTSKTNPVPRVISPRDPKYNIRVGRYLWNLEHKLFKSIGKLFHDEHPTVIKGFNASRSAKILLDKWELFHEPVAIGLDASRFDQHVSTEALEWEHEIYKKCFRSKKHKIKLGNLLSQQLENHCSGWTQDGQVSYTVKGTRMSGDMNTSLGNCLLMCSMVKAYFLHKNVNAQLANNGDDCVVFLEKRDVSHFMDGLSEWFLKLGFNMMVEKPVYEFCQLEFCQTKPIYDGVEWTMCRNPHTAIAKDSVMLHKWDNDRLFKGWLDAVGTGGLALTARLPVFQSFYQCYVRSGKKRKTIPKGLLPWSFENMRDGMRRKEGIVRPEARCSFWEAFDITPDEQIAIEKYYDELSVTNVPGPYEPRSVFKN